MNIGILKYIDIHIGVYMCTYQYIYLIEEISCVFICWVCHLDKLLLASLLAKFPRIKGEKSFA